MEILSAGGKQRGEIRQIGDFELWRRGVWQEYMELQRYAFESVQDQAGSMRGGFL